MSQVDSDLEPLTKYQLRNQQKLMVWRSLYVIVDLSHVGTCFKYVAYSHSFFVCISVCLWKCQHPINKEIELKDVGNLSDFRHIWFQPQP